MQVGFSLVVAELVHLPRLSAPRADGTVATAACCIWSPRLGRYLKTQTNKQTISLSPRVCYWGDKYFWSFVSSRWTPAEREILMERTGENQIGDRVRFLRGVILFSGA